MRNYLVFVHGIGDQERGEYQGFQEKIRRAAAREARRRGHSEFSPDDIVWQSAYWAAITQPDQDRLKDLLGVRGLIRPFMVDSLGDAITLSRLPGGLGKYTQIQGVFTEALNALSQAAERESPGVRVPLTVLAHSLGTVIATGTIDNLQNPETEDSFPPNLELKHLFTFGSPVALYGLRYGLENFDRPTQVPDWRNFYYRQDIVAYPLGPLGGPWPDAVEDVALSAWRGFGPWKDLLHGLGSSVPLLNLRSHSWYFTDSQMLRAIARALVDEWLAT